MACKALHCSIMNDADWDEIHKPHMKRGKDFDREPFPHPSGKWFWVVCQCGAKNLRDGIKRDIDDVEATDFK